MYSKILLPVDQGIKTNELITAEAKELAKEIDCDLEIYTIYVEDIDVPDSDRIEPIKRFKDNWDYDIDNVEINTDIVDGNTVSQISKYVNEYDIDLIIMAKHNRSKLKEFIYGSTTDKTIEETDCPVLVINKD